MNSQRLIHDFHGLQIVSQCASNDLANKTTTSAPASSIDLLLTSTRGQSRRRS
jgi:hypothetical protein